MAVLVCVIELFLHACSTSSATVISVTLLNAIKGGDVNLIIIIISYILRLNFLNIPSSWSVLFLLPSPVSEIKNDLKYDVMKKFGIKLTTPSLYPKIMTLLFC